MAIPKGTPKTHKDKGPDYERKTCQKLSLWVTNGRREDAFWRSAMSGGRATLKSRKEGNKREFNGQSGDICAIHEEGHALTNRFVLECKCVASLEITTHLYGAEGFIGQFWRVLTEQARQSGKMPLLLCKENRHADLAVTDQTGYKFLTRGGDIDLLFTIPRTGMYIFLQRDLMTDIDFSLATRHDV